jgi:hypothetical protein
MTNDRSFPYEALAACAEKVKAGKTNVRADPMAMQATVELARHEIEASCNVEVLSWDGPREADIVCSDGPMLIIEQKVPFVLHGDSRYVTDLVGTMSAFRRQHPSAVLGVEVLFADPQIQHGQVQPLKRDRAKRLASRVHDRLSHWLHGEPFDAVYVSVGDFTRAHGSVAAGASHDDFYEDLARLFHVRS